MSLEKRLKTQAEGIRKMGWAFMLISLVIFAITYHLPNDDGNYWLSEKGKQGFYSFSVLFLFFSLYCLGSVWRRKNFL